MSDTTKPSRETGVAGPVPVPAPAPAAGHLSPGHLSLLPASRAAQAALWLVLVMAAALVFSAWLRPNMIFDLADMVFCN